jgi:hypothetical protein
MNIISLDSPTLPIRSARARAPEIVGPILRPNISAKERRLIIEALGRNLLPSILDQYRREEAADAARGKSA